MKLDILEVKCLLWLDDEDSKRVKFFQEDLWDFINYDLLEWFDLTEDGLKFTVCDSYEAELVKSKVIEWLEHTNSFEKHWFEFDHPMYQGKTKGGWYCPFQLMSRHQVKQYRSERSGCWVWCLPEDWEDIVDQANDMIEKESTIRFEKKLLSEKTFYQERMNEPWQSNSPDSK